MAPGVSTVKACLHSSQTRLIVAMAGSSPKDSDTRGGIIAGRHRAPQLVVEEYPRGYAWPDPGKSDERTPP